MAGAVASPVLGTAPISNALRAGQGGVGAEVHGGDIAAASHSTGCYARLGCARSTASTRRTLAAQRTLAVVVPWRNGSELDQSGVSQQDRLPE